MRKPVLVIANLFFAFLLLPSAYATMGIGIMPTKLDMTFVNEDELAFKVKIINSGNIDLKINITSSDAEIIPEKNNYVLQACRCKNYCSLTVTDCDSVSPPDELIIRIKNPKKALIDYITFSGRQLIEGGQVVTTGVSAKMRINITYKGQVPKEEPKEEEESQIVYTASNPSSSSQTTTSTTIPQIQNNTTGVVEPSDQERKPIRSEPAVENDITTESKMPFGVWIERNLNLIIMSTGGVGICSATIFIGYYFVNRRRRLNKILEESSSVIITQPVVYPETYPTAYSPPVPFPSSDQLIIDETKKQP